MNRFCEQFHIEDNVLINISEKIEKHNYQYYPCSGLLEKLHLVKNKQDPFFYHYITDKCLLGINGIRESEKLVIPLSLNLKLSEEFYYIDTRTNYIYKYKHHILQPLTVNYYYMSYQILKTIKAFRTMIVLLKSYENRSEL